MREKFLGAIMREAPRPRSFRAGTAPKALALLPGERRHRLRRPERATNPSAQRRLAGSPQTRNRRLAGSIKSEQPAVGGPPGPTAHELAIETSTCSAAAPHLPPEPWRPDPHPLR